MALLKLLTTVEVKPHFQKLNPVPEIVQRLVVWHVQLESVQGLISEGTGPVSGPVLGIIDRVRDLNGISDHPGGFIQQISDASPCGDTKMIWFDQQGALELLLHRSHWQNAQTRAWLKRCQLIRDCLKHTLWRFSMAQHPI